MEITQVKKKEKRNDCPNLFLNKIHNINCYCAGPKNYLESTFPMVNVKFDFIVHKTRC